MILGAIRRARGVRGEVVVETFGSSPERFQPGLRVFLSPPGDREAVIESAWVHDGKLVLKFRGIDTRTGAEALRGAELRIPEEERPPAPEGEYYLSDLIGCRMETAEGRLVGQVRGYRDYGAAPLLEVVSPAKREILVPFARGIYREVDLQERRIVVDLPEGLEDL